MFPIQGFMLLGGSCAVLSREIYCFNEGNSERHIYNESKQLQSKTRFNLNCILTISSQMHFPISIRQDERWNLADMWAERIHQYMKRSIIFQFHWITEAQTKALGADLVTESYQRDLASIKYIMNMWKSAWSPNSGLYSDHLWFFF